MDLALPIELGLLEVLFGQRVFHLLEAVVVHLGGVDVTADHLRLEGLPEIDGDD